MIPKKYFSIFNNSVILSYFLHYFSVYRRLIMLNGFFQACFFFTVLEAIEYTAYLIGGSFPDRHLQHGFVDALPPLRWRTKWKDAEGPITILSKNFILCLTECRVLCVASTRYRSDPYLQGLLGPHVNQTRSTIQNRFLI